MEAIKMLKMGEDPTEYLRYAKQVLIYFIKLLAKPQ